MRIRTLGSAKAARRAARTTDNRSTLKGAQYGYEEKSREEEVLQEKNREEEVVEEACSEEEVLEEESSEEEVLEEESGQEEEAGPQGGEKEEASEEEGGEAQARDGRGTDEAHGPGGHPGYHAADQADELNGRPRHPKARRLDPNTRRDPTGPAQAEGSTAG
jgi:hypothetical protein